MAPAPASTSAGTTTNSGNGGAPVTGFKSASFDSNLGSGSSSLPTVEKRSSSPMSPRIMNQKVSESLAAQLLRSASKARTGRGSPRASSWSSDSVVGQRSPGKMLQGVMVSNHSHPKVYLGGGGGGRLLFQNDSKFVGPSATTSAASNADLGMSPRKVHSKQSRPNPEFDRYIPSQSNTDLASSHFHLSQNNTASSDKNKDSANNTSVIPPVNGPRPKPLDSAALCYQEELAKACGINMNKRILAFKLEPPAPSTDILQTMWSRHPNARKGVNAPMPATHRRRISTMPERVLDAPGLADDYYLNLLDWSASNLLAVGLEGTVYVWNATTGDVSEFCHAPDGSPSEVGAVTSVQWTTDASHLAVGTKTGDTIIFDGETGTKVRTMRGHMARVGVLSWDRHILSSGCKDGSIWNHDVRVAQHKVAELLGHSAEVCGLKWRADGGMLASGGNDNLVNIWDARSSTPKHTKSNHNAAVKAVGWCPWQLNLLATGGGTHDRMIHFWNTQTGAKISSIDTGSQVTSLIWSRDFKELLSTHGFPDNQLSLWSYPSLQKVIDLPGHDSRVLHASLSPDGQTVVTAAGDENLKFWKTFERQKGTKSAATVSAKAIGLSAAGKEASEDDELVKATKAMTIR